MVMTVLPVELGRVELAPAAALFRSLGDPARLAILRRLAGDGPARVVDLVKGLDLAQSTVSKHLAWSAPNPSGGRRCFGWRSRR